MSPSDPSTATPEVSGPQAYAERFPRCGCGGEILDARYPTRGFTRLCRPCLEVAIPVLGQPLSAAAAAAATLLEDMKDVTSQAVQARWTAALEAAGREGRRVPDTPYLVVRAALEALAAEGGRPPETGPAPLAIWPDLQAFLDASGAA